MIPKQDNLISKIRIVTDIMTSELKTESTSIQITLDDIESRNNRIRREMITAGGVASSQKEKIITLVKEWTYNLELLVDNKLVLWNKDSIYSTIYSNLQKDGMSDVGMQYVRDLFRNPDYDRFKVVKNLPASSPPPLGSLITYQKKAYEIEKSSSDIQVNDAIFTLESNLQNPKVREYMQRQFVTYEKEVKKTKQAEKDLEKICMEHPEPQITTFSEALKRLSKIAEIAYKRVETYAPTDLEDTNYYTRGVLLYTKWLESIADLKHSRSNYSWIDIQIEKNTQSTHSAMSKSKIEAFFKSKEYQHLKGTLRKVTREQIDAKEEEIITLCIDLIRLAPELTGDENWLMIRDIFNELLEEGHPSTLIIAEHVIHKLGPILLGLDHYKDKYQAGWNAGFHVRRHDKLSESAFGNASLH